MKVRSLSSDLSCYKASGWGYTTADEAAATRALARLEEAFLADKAQAETNAPAIESNKTAIDRIASFMKACGIPDTWFDHYYKSHRSTTRSTRTNLAGYRGDLTRNFIVTDDWSQVEARYEELKRRWTEVITKATRDLEAAARSAQTKKENEHRARQKAQRLAIIVVKYGLPEDSSWYDALLYLRANPLDVEHQHVEWAEDYTCRRSSYDCDAENDD